MDRRTAAGIVRLLTTAEQVKLARLLKDGLDLPSALTAIAMARDERK